MIFRLRRDIIATMHKTVYASGFLYHPKSEQILLQQSTLNAPQLWSMFSIEGKSSVPPGKLFADMMSKVLKINLKPKEVHEIYEYDNKKGDKEYTILYSVVSRTQEFPPKKDTLYSWFSKKQISKLPLDPQTKQDIIVGLRVIDAKLRKSLGEHTLE